MATALPQLIDIHWMVQLYAGEHKTRQYLPSLHCVLSLVVQCIVIGPVCGWVCGCVSLFVGLLRLPIWSSGTVCDHQAKYTDWPNQLDLTGYEYGNAKLGQARMVQDQADQIRGFDGVLINL